MMNIKSIMQQAKAMQKKMEEEQAKAAMTEVEGSSAGGMVKVVLNGKGDLKKLNIDKTLINPEEVDILEDLIIAAFSDGKAKADKMSEDGMKDITGGLNLGGMKLPF